MAIAEGADIVFEIPACYATGSLDDFSMGAVSLLDSLGVISHLVFGSESGSLSTISRISHAMMADVDSFQIIRSAMKTGLSLSMAKRTVLSEIQNEQLFTSCIDAVNQPNNMLGIFYLNALSNLRSAIVPVTHTRLGQAYNDDSRNNMVLDNHFASATAIRKQLSAGLARGEKDAANEIVQFVPTASFHLLVDALQIQRPISENDCWGFLCEALSATSNELTDYRLVSPIIAGIIANGWKRCNSWDSLVSYISSPDVSPARVNRSLIHILLGITENIMQDFFNHEICCYAKVLAKSENGEALLEQIHRTSKVPVLPPTNVQNLSPRAMSQLQIDQVADSIYECLRFNTCIE